MAKRIYEYNNEPVQKCGKCDAMIFFVKGSKGGNIPINKATLEPHFADCPAAAHFRKAKG